jgi:RHS repeat-associated protein
MPRTTTRQLVLLTTFLATACGQDRPHHGAGDGGPSDGGPTPDAIVYTETTLTPPATASPVNRTVATDFFEATRFLFEGAAPLQTGVTPGAITRENVTVLRGRTLDRDGAPLSGVAVFVVHHPELGQTATRADGALDLAAVGGRRVTVKYEQPGFLPVYRQLAAPLRAYGWLPDVRLTPRDAQVTTIDPSTATALEAASGSQVSDPDGDRRALVLFTPGTTAIARFPDGTQTPLPGPFSVRATEYTVGPSGPEAMPAELPATSGYTYAVELGIDEAEALGASGVEFSQPVVFYLENFLDFPVGGAVPAGYYDANLTAWVPSPNGRVVEVVAISAGLASLDTDGDGTADEAEVLATLGISDEERALLAERYSTGQTLWRVALSHFSPWDYNWPYGPPDDAIAAALGLRGARGCTDPCKGCGSVIECQNQVLGESIGIVGTDLSLVYRSDRVMGRRDAFTVDIQVSDSTLPASLKRILLLVEVAGRRFAAELPPAPDQVHRFTWDGRDGYGRLLQGTQPAVVGVGYVYDAEYQDPSVWANAFGQTSGVSREGDPARMEVTIWRRQQTTLGTWDAQAFGLGGWSLTGHHAYDPAGRKVYLGEGESRSASALPGVMERVAGTGVEGFSGDLGPASAAQFAIPSGLAFGVDGSLYVADWNNQRIRRLGLDGTVSTVAGNGTLCDLGADPACGDGGAATAAPLYFPDSVAVGPDGSLYVVESERYQVRRVDPDGVITTFAGHGQRCYQSPCGYGGPAREAQLDSVNAGQGGLWVAVASDGTVYVADNGRRRVHRVALDGIVYPFAGGGTAGAGDGGPATEARFAGVAAIAVGPDGSVYIPDPGDARVRRVGPDGIIQPFAGDGTNGYGGDGGAAELAQLNRPSAVAVGPGETVYLLDQANYRVRVVSPSGIIETLAGDGADCAATFPACGDGGPAPQANLSGNSGDGLAISPEGVLHVSDAGNHVIRRVRPALPGLAVSDFLVPSERGEALYWFDAYGRHRRTLEAFTFSTLAEFGYDAEGRLTTITDVDGDAVLVDRSPTGAPAALVSPFGQRTTLTLDASAFLASVTDPAGDTEQLEHGTDGLLRSRRDARGGVHGYEYDAFTGRLTRDTNAAGGFTALAETDLGLGFEVRSTTAEGRESFCRVEYPTPSSELRTSHFPSGVEKVELRQPDGLRSLTYPDGTQATLLEGPDARWGLMAALPRAMTVTTPGGLLFELGMTSAAVLAAPGDPLSLQTLTLTVDVNGRQHTSTYDATARSWTQQSFLGRQRTSTLDAAGRVVEDGFPGLAPTRLTWDSRGRIATSAVGTGVNERLHTFGYDASGNLSTVTDPLSRITTFEYDAAGRVVRQVWPDGRAVLLGYDASGNVTSVTPPGRPGHAFSYTPADLAAQYTPPSAGLANPATLYEYDLDQALTRVTRPDGVSVDLAYDAAGRPSLVTLPTGAIEYHYDAATAQLASVTSPGGVDLAFGYDAALVTTATWSGPVAGTVAWAYDDDFLVSSVTVNGGPSITLGYDEDLLLVQAGDLVLARDPGNGLVTGTTLGAVTTANGFDAFGEVETTIARHGATTLLQTTYVHDRLGRIASFTETVLGVTSVHAYTYDDAGRLTEARDDGVLVAQYGYDDNGNRESTTDSFGTVTATYDDQDRLQTHGGTTFTYTANGELTSRTSAGTTTTFDYDVLGNLLSVDLPDGRTIAYVVDGLGRRLGKRVDGVLVQGLLYDDDLRPIAELDGSGAAISRFVYGSDGQVPSYLTRGGATYRLVADHLGSPRLVVDVATGQIAQELAYDVFGRVLVDTNPGFQPFGFAGGLYDPDTGLVRFGARDYDAETGRWTSKDPIGFGGGDTNFYGYVLSDPVNLVDPSGLLVPLTWDTAADGANIIYGGFRILKDNVFGNCKNLKTNLLALGADVVGAIIPGVTGLGAVVRARAAVSAGRVGRAGKQLRLRALARDGKLCSRDRGWIKQEINAMQRGNRTSIRVPPGRVLAHRRGQEARKGYDYCHADMQDVGLHKLQHMVEGYK